VELQLEQGGKGASRNKNRISIGEGRRGSSIAYWRCFGGKKKASASWGREEPEGGIPTTHLHTLGGKVGHDWHFLKGETILVVVGGDNASHAAHAFFLGNCPRVEKGLVKLHNQSITHNRDCLGGGGPEQVALGGVLWGLTEKKKELKWGI